MMHALGKREQAQSEFYRRGGPAGASNRAPSPIRIPQHPTSSPQTHSKQQTHSPTVLNGDRISVGANLRSLTTPSLSSFPTTNQHFPPFFLSQLYWRCSDAALHPPWPRQRPTGEGQGVPRRSEGRVRYSEGRPESLQGLAPGEGTMDRRDTGYTAECPWYPPPPKQSGLVALDWGRGGRGEERRR
jgi:hypothetical protein